MKKKILAVVITIFIMALMNLIAWSMVYRPDIAIHFFHAILIIGFIGSIVGIFVVVKAYLD